MSVGTVAFEVEDTAIEGLWLLTMKQASDERGVVRELYRGTAFADAGLPAFTIVQVNVTETNPGAVRGLHAEQMHKLVAVAHGRAFGAWVDLRPGTGRGCVVTADLVPGRQALVSPGIANGFQSLGDSPTQYVYAFDHEWAPGMAGDAVHPLDPQLAIQWPMTPVLSEKDAAQPYLLG